MSPTAGDTLPILSGIAIRDGAGINLTDAVTRTVQIRRSDGALILGTPTLGNQTTAPGSWTREWLAGEMDLPGVYTVALEVEWTAGRIETFGESSFRVKRQLDTGPAYVPAPPPAVVDNGDGTATVTWS